MSSFPLSRALAATALGVGLAIASPAQAVGPLGWIVLDQALSRVFSPSGSSAAMGPPTAEQRQRLFAQTAQAAETLNQFLPIDLGSGLAATRAAAAAPAELELEFLALSADPSELSAERVDQRWGAGIRSQICQSPFFQAWMAQGGSLRMSVRARDASLARQYFANETDCPR